MSNAESSGQKAYLITITADQAGQRLDNFLLSHLKSVPKSHVYRLLRSGQVRVNKGRKKPHYRLCADDSVRIPPVRTRQSAEVTIPQEMIEESGQRILLEDEHIVVVDKIAGMPVHAGSGYRYGVIDVLRAARPDQKLELVHRLDRDTSGCLLLTKSRHALTRCHTAFREMHADLGKHYLCLVAGHWPEQNTIDAPIGRAMRSGERMMQIDQEGDHAVSHFECEKLFDREGLRASLMRVRIETGRTHQIRVHATSEGHPLAGDDKYGDRDFNRAMRTIGLKRLFLHASKLEFDLPDLGNYAIEAPMPDELAAIIEALS